MFSAPGLSININGTSYEYHSDSDLQPNDPTNDLNQSMNAVVLLPYSQLSYGRAYSRDFGKGLDDSQYDVHIYHGPAVDNQVVPLLMRHEAPDVPVTNLPFKEQLYNTTLVQQKVEGQILYSALRSPGINEGI